MDNQTSVSEILLLEFPAIQELQILLFVLFLVLYLTTVAGNLLIFSAIAFDHHLHTPLYFFLMNLAIQDLGSVSVTIPKYMINSFMNDRHICYSACVAQVFMLLFFVGSDLALLTAMAYDRYIAICYPLQYEMIMNRGACIQIILGVWFAALLIAILHTGATFTIPFCSNVVNQFFCEIPQLLKLACSEYKTEMVMILLSFIVWFGCFSFIIVTYVEIFTAVLKIPSVQGRKKAFSTCIPHLFVVSMFSLTSCLAYLRPTSSTASSLDLIFSVLYSVLPPMLNPLIYSMRNKDIKVALSRLLSLRSSYNKAFFICVV